MMLKCRPTEIKVDTVLTCTDNGWRYDRSPSYFDRSHAYTVVHDMLSHPYQFDSWVDELYALAFDAWVVENPEYIRIEGNTLRQICDSARGRLCDDINMPDSVHSAVVEGLRMTGPIPRLEITRTVAGLYWDAYRSADARYPTVSRDQLHELRRSLRHALERHQADGAAQVRLKLSEDRAGNFLGVIGIGGSLDVLLRDDRLAWNPREHRFPLKPLD